VNTTLAASLAASKLGLPIIHIEAGLRSHDRSMPEEINRVVVDHLSQVLLCSEPAGVSNLNKEGISENVFLSGNLMVNTLLQWRSIAKQRPVLNAFNLVPKSYGLVTLHRQSNVDDEASLSLMLRVLEAVADKVPLVFPVHPRTAQRLKAHPLLRSNKKTSQIRFIEPLGYLDFLCLMDNSKFLLTDSGGIQEETTALGIPCLVLRENTERPITLQQGSGTLVGTDVEKAQNAIHRILSDSYSVGECPAFWDDKVGERMLSSIQSFYASFDKIQKRAA
jgi:UDP-N-acetylglucosamine 2-epimerase (non-hydrolysing)